MDLIIKEKTGKVISQKGHKISSYDYTNFGNESVLTGRVMLELYVANSTLFKSILISDEDNKFFIYFQIV